MKTNQKNFICFLAALVLAGLFHVSDKSILTLLVRYGAGKTRLYGAPYLSTLGFCLNLAIYALLLLWWNQSLQRRLLPARPRTYLICIALLMIFYLALRSAKYRFAEGNDPFLRVLWYLYYIPLIFIPTLFLMTCIFMEKQGSPRRFDERLLLLPAALLTAAVLTNDLHRLVFRFDWDWLLIGSQGTYVNQFGYYVILGYMGLEFLCGMLLLTRVNRAERSVKTALAPFGFLLLLGALLVLERVFGYYGTPRPYNPPEIVVFCMLGILETCVRSRLIPHNENYAGFYRAMELSSMITDRRLAPVYTTAVPIPATPEQLAASLDAPVRLDSDTRLFGSRLSAGCSFYTQDESELRRLNERLSEANALLSSENELIRAENELKQKLARVESRNRIYSRVSKALFRKRAQLAALLDCCEAGDAELRASLARVSLMTAYMKRAGNLLLSEDDGRTLPREALALALEETARYLPYCGITPLVADLGKGSIPCEEAFLLYTAFEDICEALVGSATMLTVSVPGGALRVSVDCSCAPEIRTEGVRVETLESEGLYFLTVRCGRGDDA